MIKLIAYNLLFYWVLVKLTDVIDIKSHVISVIFYLWAFLIFNFVLRSPNKIWRISAFIVAIVLPFVVTTALTNLTGETVHNFFNMNFVITGLGNLGEFRLYPYLLYMLIATIVIFCIERKKKYSFLF